MLLLLTAVAVAVAALLCVSSLCALHRDAREAEMQRLLLSLIMLWLMLVFDDDVEVDVVATIASSEVESCYELGLEAALSGVGIVI